MCGIAGFYNTDLTETHLKRMLTQLIHRGPDDQAVFADAPFMAGMQRLAINGLSDGNQPLTNETKDVVLLYNGEIYNAHELKSALVAKGHKFTTHSDGEVICHLYEEYGLKLFELLDGMFAAALWLKKEQRLVLARDFIGEKPLYFARLGNNSLIFSSEIKAIHSISSAALSLNYQAIWDFPTFLWIPEPNTIFNEIKALDPGHLLIVSMQGIEKRCYVGESRSRIPNDFTADDIYQITKSIVTESVHSRLMSEVPVGCFLSSGLDSSIVTTLSARRLPQIDTFSIGFEDLDDPYHGKSDESTAAAELANNLGTRHHTIRVTGKDFRELLPQFCFHGDQPFAVSSGLGILKIAEHANHFGIKVLLSGDGADEFFAGYSWYNHFSSYSQRTQRQSNATTAPVSYQSFGIPLNQRIEMIKHYSKAEQAWAWHYYAHESEKRQLFNQEWYQTFQPNSSLSHFSWLEELDSNQFPLAFIEHDRRFYFPNEMLTKVDRMCMAHSVESRVPLASKKLIDWARSLPINTLLNGQTIKIPLREAFKDLLPDSVINRPKHGFNVPIDHWLKSSWFDLLQHAFSKESALFKHGIISQQSVNAANRLLADPLKLNGHTLFCFIMLNMWLENEYNRNYR